MSGSITVNDDGRRWTDKFQFWLSIALMLALSVQCMITTFISCYAIYVLNAYDNALGLVIQTYSQMPGWQ